MYILWHTVSNYVPLVVHNIIYLTVLKIYLLSESKECLSARYVFALIYVLALIQYIQTCTIYNTGLDTLALTYISIQIIISFPI